MGRRSSLWGLLATTACVAALLSRQAASATAPVAFACEAPVVVHEALTCAHDPPALTADAAGEVACEGLVRAGERVRCGRGGVERGYMSRVELAALEVRLPLNDAPAEALASIRGVGPVLAERICARRPFRELREVLTVRGVGDRKHEAIAARACVECAPPRPLRF